MREILDLMWRPGPVSSGENLQARVTECPVGNNGQTSPLSVPRSATRFT